MKIDKGNKEQMVPCNNHGVFIELRGVEDFEVWRLWCEHFHLWGICGEASEGCAGKIEKLSKHFRRRLMQIRMVQQSLAEGIEAS